jgi:peptidyl-prolyl cis-trans isomerase A (cyclophilin A)
MKMRMPGKAGCLAAVISAASLAAATANATIVEINTVQGPFQVNLYDNATPQTVTNFLNYVNNGAYTDSILHRTVSNFIVQGGGFNTNVNAQIGAIPTNPPVVNEPVYSNVRGTIAMAKVAGNPNSATSQWFINLSDNSANLDGQNGGFTVFGQVVGNGMTVVDAVAALPRFNIGSPLTELPLRNYTATDAANNVPIDNTHLIIVNSVTVTDSTVNTAAGLNPPRNMATNGGNNGGDGGGGGSLAWFGVFALLLIRAYRQWRN